MNSKKFVKQAGKYLECSREKRKQVEQQIAADVQEIINSGETMEKVEELLGSPEMIAGKFNKTFGVSEKQKYKKEKRIKTLLQAAVVLVIVIIGTVRLMPDQVSLAESEIFEEAEVIEKSKEVIDLFEEGDVESLQEMSVEQIKEALNEEAMASIQEGFGTDWGEFVSYGDFYSAETTQNGDTYAMVQVEVAYENVSIKYALTFDKDLQLAGIYIK